MVSNLLSFPIHRLAPASLNKGYFAWLLLSVITLRRQSVFSLVTNITEAEICHNTKALTTISPECPSHSLVYNLTLVSIWQCCQEHFFIIAKWLFSFNMAEPYAVSGKLYIRTIQLIHSTKTRQTVYKIAVPLTPPALYLFSITM